MRIAIVDDEELEIRDLKKMLTHFADSQRLDICYDCFLDGDTFLAAGILVNTIWYLWIFI